MMGDKPHELTIVDNSRLERREANSDEDSEIGEDEHDSRETFREELVSDFRDIFSCRVS